MAAPPAVTGGKAAVVSRERRVMGSPLRMTLVLPGSPSARAAAVLADAAWQAVSDEFDATDLALSRFRADSEVTALNRHCLQDVVVGPRLYAALTASLRAWRRTGGRFDPRVLADLERLGYAGAGLGPAPDDARRLGSDEPATWLDRDPCGSRVRIAAAVDLGGIGKGLAVRWAMKRLARVAAAAGWGAMIDAGGDVAVRGPSPSGEAWSIGIEDPPGATDPIAVVALPEGAICTSSTRTTHWTSPTGVAVHHLIDPATGEPGGDGLVSVTVAGPDPAWAEVWSKTLFLAGPAAIGELARARGLAAWWIDDAGALSMTPAARQVTRWLA